MDYSQIIETIGSITKYEKLVSLTGGIEKNSLVLRSMQPYPGAGVDETAPSQASHYIILRYRYAPEKINRINCIILKETNLSRYPSYGEIIYANQVLPCVRIKAEANPEKIQSVQKCLLKNDLQLMAYKEINADCKIKIFKTFKLAEIGDGLYRDLYDGEKIYIRVQSQLNWKRFEAIIKKIKFNIQEQEFDAAIGVIYRFTGPENVIRIFDKNKTYKRAVDLRKQILSEIKDEIHLSAAHQKQKL